MEITMCWTADHSDRGASDGPTSPSAWSECTTNSPRDIWREPVGSFKRLCTEAAAALTLAMLGKRDPAGEIGTWLERIAAAVD
jgi:hypothetical protein